MYYIYYLIIFILLVSALIYYQSVYNELIYVESSIDNVKYLVRNDEQKQDSANYMAKIKKNIRILIEHLKVNYSDDKRVIRLIKKYNSDNISESMKSSIYTSYSINKGEKIVICIKDKDTKESFINLNTIMFVVIHELAHIITTSIGHNDDFWNNMKFLLEQAIKVGIYTKQDYKMAPEKYCGIMITDTPIDK